MATEAWIIGLHAIPAQVRYSQMRRAGETRTQLLFEVGAYLQGNFVVKEDDELPVIMTREQFHEEFDWLSSAQDAEEQDAFRPSRVTHPAQVQRS